MKTLHRRKPFSLLPGFRLAALLLAGSAAVPVRADVLTLDGNGDYVTFPATGIPSGSASFTIECWINPTSIPTGGENGGVMTFWGNEGTANQANGFRLRGAQGLRHFFWSNDHDENLTQNILGDTTGPNADGWHHFALVWNGTQTRWYWNGVAIGNPRTAAGVNVAAAQHRIGSRPGGEFFHGYMDEVRVWSVARSAGEIAADFQRQLAGSEPGLVAYWNFEGDLVDRAGGNNNGTAVGNAAITPGLSAPVQPVPRIFSFTASPGQVFLGQSVTLSWAVSNASSVVIDHGVGSQPPSNSIVLAPASTTTYTLTATNELGARTAAVTVTVDPGVPVAHHFATNTAVNTPVAITLRGTDPQGSNLTFAIVSPPAHGGLSGTPPNVTYTPVMDYGGLDSFTFKVNDGAQDSAVATVSLVVGPFDPPRRIVINEIHYNPSFNPIRESFLELHNDTDATVDLSQWRVRGGVDFFFPAGTFVGPRAFVIVAEDPATIQSRHGRAAFGPWSGGLNTDGEELTLRDASNALVDVVDYRNEFPWPVAPDGNGPSAQLVHAALDNDLGSSWRSALPTPGATNSIFATNAAPHLRQVDHSPNSPRSTNLVTVTCKVTDPDGVASVTLAYQVVAPGSFIPATLPLSTAQLNSLNTTPMTNALNAAFELPANWTTAPMHDDGVNGDAVAGDGIYSVLLPQQAHRTLVRYRITCADTLGAARRAPFEDDPSLNFAYFVYDGVPNYLGFSSSALQTLPIYTLITRDADLTHCTAWANTGDQLPQTLGAARNEGRLHFNWEAAFVHDGKVFDHVTYRLRGANGRYHPGKRSFRIKFKDGALFQADDQNGNRFPTKWREITTGKGQSNRGGEQFALNEVVNYFLWNKVGVPAPRTLHFHFRVIRGAAETNQYSGDFWGLNWAQEKYDANFLEAHDLPKGNLYKLYDNPGTPHIDELRYQASLAVTNAADLFNLENNLDGFKSADWLNAHANYTNWYRYFTIARAIRHYDTWPSANKNGTYYFEPLYSASNGFLGRMMQLPYDSTDTWGATWNNGDDILYNGIFSSGALGGDAGQNPAMQLEFRNVAREIRTLLFQPDQIGAIIDAHAAPIAPVAAADYARWLNNTPAAASYAGLLIPSSPGVTGGLAAYQQDMKNFMFTGGNNAWWVSDPTYGQTVPAGGWITVLDTSIADAAIPSRPVITYAGTNGFPIDGLVFESSAFSDPQGAGTFAAMQWRIAEVLLPGTVVSNLGQLRLEWDAAFTSPELTSFNEFFTFPDFVTTPDLIYRARVRHKDDTDRWSQWSLPVEFRPSPRDTTSQLRTNLVFSEIMYNPPGDGVNDGDEFEFLELQNTGPFSLNLSGLFFSDGIDFTFTNGTTLAPGATFLLARNPAMLATRHPGVTVHGDYADKLNNDGETVTISHPAAGEIVSLTYGDRGPWPVTPDGFGFSLVRDADGSYRGSSAVFGTPGATGGATAIGGVVINEVLSASTLPLKDTIELLNLSGASVDISGWWLSDDPSFPQKFRIPARPSLTSGEFAVFTEDDFNPTPGLGTSFSLSSFGDDAYLFSADGPGNLTGYSHGFTFGASQDGVSFGRHVNSVGDEQLPLQTAHTPGATNTGPRTGPVVLSEIHYHPRTNVDAFIELLNLTGTPVALSNSTNNWRVNGVDFSFPAGVSIPANGCVLLVADDTNAFRARWNVPASVAIFQYAGNLQDSGENLEVLAPDSPATNGVPFYSVDTVRYNDRKPWPLAADGAGASLQRITNAAYGNDPVNWAGATPTPGTHLLGGTPPGLTSHPASRTNGTTTTATFSVSATGSAPIFYQWRVNGGNIDGATNSTLVLPNLQLADAGTYQAVVFNSAGSTDSSNALLIVRGGPALTLQPTNLFLRVAPDPLYQPTNRATFAVAAVSYNPPLSLQWQFNGANLPGETNATLSFSNVTFAHEGTYQALLTDTASTALSAPAYLQPLVGLTLAQPALSHTVVSGAVVSLSAAVSGYPPPYSMEWRRQTAPVTSYGTNFQNEPATFFNFVNTNLPGNVQYRLIIRNLATPNGIITQPIVTTLADTDADGLADHWETNYFNTLGALPADDADGDGLSNAQEYTAGTDPTNAASHLRLTLALPGPALSFGAVSNKTYTLQYTDVLPAPGGLWQKLADVLARTTNRVETIPDPAWTTRRFYRAVTPRQ